MNGRWTRRGRPGTAEWRPTRSTTWAAPCSASAIWAPGRARLDQSLEISLSEGLEEHAARAYTNIGALQAAKRMLADAAATFRTGIDYCGERDHDSSSLYMRAWLAGVLMEQGNTEAAVDLAHEVLRHPQLALVSRVTATLPLIARCGTARRCRRGPAAGPPARTRLVAPPIRCGIYRWRCSRRRRRGPPGGRRRS